MLDFFNFRLSSRGDDLINLVISVQEKVLFDNDSGLNPAHGAFIAELACLLERDLLVRIKKFNHLVVNPKARVYSPALRLICV